MATTADKRAWLRENGYEPQDKGPLSPKLLAIWDGAHPGQADTPDYPDAEFEAAFPAAPNGDSAAELEARETRPRRPPRHRGRVFGFGKPKGAARRKAKGPRLSTADVISSVWGGLARLARPVPPMARILAIQAPVAGVILDPAVKGTAVDTLLQYAARAQLQGKVVAGLAGPPVLVGAITVHLQQCAAAGTDPNPIFMGLATELLRESLLLYADVAGPKFAEAAERVRRREEQLGGPVDDIMALIFSPVPDPSDVAAVQAENEAIRRAQGLLDDATIVE